MSISSYCIFLSLVTLPSITLSRPIHIAASGIISFFLKAQSKMGRTPKQTFLQRRHTDGQEAHAAAALLQSCPTLCDPIDGCPPGSPVPGILQARTLEWVAISLSNA